MRLLHGDCVELMRTLEPDSVDAVVADPPYHLSFMGKAWDHAPSPAESVETHRLWAVEAMRVLRPGGFLLAFAGSRTQHRLGYALELAGFEVRDTLLWLFGSGFPKSYNVSKAIDAAAGVEREVVGPDPQAARRNKETPKFESTYEPYAGQGAQPVTAPATDEAKRWDGWGTALKPAYEPVVVARKPLEGTVVENVLKHGTGALNIDGCRIATPDDLGGGAELDEQSAKPEGWDRPWRSDPDAQAAHAARVRENVARAEQLGRWPANVVLAHTEECRLLGEREVAANGCWPEARGVGTFSRNGHEGLSERQVSRETVEEWDCRPDCPVRMLDEQTGEVGAQAPVLGTEPSGAFSGSVYGEMARAGGTFYGDKGGASRFFYVAKVSRAERDAGLDERELRTLNWSSGDENPGAFQSEGTNRLVRNGHPTVKPIELMRWLVRLVCRPGGTVLDPFLGSGSTGIAAALEGMEFVGMERDPEYLAIAEARIGFWQEHGEEALRVVQARETADRRRAEVAAAGQLELL